MPTQTLLAGGVEFAYRELGKQHGGTPVVFLNHLAAVLDNWDPRVVEGIAARHHVIVFDNRGVGATTGAPANSIEQMADDAITFIKATGFRQVDLLGFSMGGNRMVPTPNSHDLARRLPNSTLIIYPDAGHGGLFQNHADFVPRALDFLVR